MSDLVHIGKIVATFGVKGELVLKHALGKKTALDGVEAIFVEETKGMQLPYFVKLSKAKNEEEIHIKIDGVDTKESAHRFIQKNIWLQDDDFRKLVGAASPIALLGFTVVNEGEVIGTVEQVIEQPHQVLLQIQYKGNEALIPLHAETLDKVDQKKKQVHVTLPDGLLEIYG
ncbi:MAG: 16S rRNA processing protein RimM [Filimonas sp.]|nr:16S rRNA processing protein RimM [Filimonas sp.]